MSSPVLMWLVCNLKAADNSHSHKSLIKLQFSLASFDLSQLDCTEVSKY